MEEKKKILSKLNIKDYRNDLELVLENKQFNEEAKSLILNIFYKLDNFYKDYISVKQDVEEKNKFLENYINTIKIKCKKIDLLKPQQLKDGNKYFVDRKNGEIQCLPNELVLLHAIYELTEKNLQEDKVLLEDFTKICVSYILNRGKTLNFTEPIRDFNGWSWSIQIDNHENIVSNLIYQNLWLLFNYKYVQDNVNKANIIELLTNKFDKEGYDEFGYEFMNKLFKLCIVVYNNISKENHGKCVRYKKSILVRKQMLKNRKEYVEDTNKDSENISKEIQNLNKMLQDITLIRNQYQESIKINPKEYFCISDFVERKEKEKQNLLKRIKVNNKVLKQKQYLTNHDNYEDSLNYYDEIDEKAEKVDYQSLIDEFEKVFLQCFKTKIEKNKIKKDLYNEVIKFRYYCNLLYEKNKSIMENSKLSTELKDVSDVLIKKLVENKIIDTGFKSEKLNYEILNYIFKTKIIELENLTIKIKFVNNKKIDVEYYDSKILENKASFEIPFEEEVTSKKDRKIKLLKIGG